MKYQELLRQQLQRRIDMNPRYSLRAFADHLDLQASKLSEILSGKKGLSLEKALHISQKLKLAGLQQEMFILSVEAQHSRFTTRKMEAANQLEKLAQRNQQLIPKTQQKCAWYYGAVETCLANGDENLQEIADQLGITILQVENAKRFLNRRAKNWPEKKHIRIEESSLLQKVQAAYVLGADHLEADAYFVSLSADDKHELQVKLHELMDEFRSRSRKKTNPAADVQMININFVSL